VPSGPGELKHLFVVCSGSCGPPDMRVIVSISSVRPGKFHDQTCPVVAGEHDFVVHESFVFYRHTELKSATDLRRFLETGYYTPKQALSAELLDRVLRGFRQSRFTAPWVLNYL
jgi:hypothetical protein